MHLKVVNCEPMLKFQKAAQITHPIFFFGEQARALCVVTLKNVACLMVHHIQHSGDFGEMWLEVVTPGIWEGPHVALPARFDRPRAYASIVSAPHGAPPLARQIAAVQMIDHCPCILQARPVYLQQMPFTQHSTVIQYND